ncbi:hypothetical protein V6N13_133493 [Hibiscus sabdariffa]
MMLKSNEPLLTYKNVLKMMTASILRAAFMVEGEPGPPGDVRWVFAFFVMFNQVHPPLRTSKRSMPLVTTIETSHL